MRPVIDNLIKDLKLEASTDVISRVAAEQLLGDIVRRIHNEGKDAQGRKIASDYSTKPMYVSLNMFVRQRGRPAGSKSMKQLKGRGKKSDDPEFRNGKKRRSRYFPDGYKGFKQEQTGNTQVNLTLTGGLQIDLEMTESNESGIWGLSFSDYGLKIYPGLEDHYKVQIWYPTRQEYNRMVKAVEDYVSRKL